MEETWKAVVGEGSSLPALALLREETKTLSAVPFRTLQDDAHKHNLEAIFRALVPLLPVLFPAETLVSQSAVLGQLSHVLGQCRSAQSHLLLCVQIASPSVSRLAAKFAKDVVASKAYKEQQEALGIRSCYPHSLPSIFIPDPSVVLIEVAH